MMQKFYNVLDIEVWKGILSYETPDTCFRDDRVRCTVFQHIQG